MSIDAHHQFDDWMRLRLESAFDNGDGSTSEVEVVVAAMDGAGPTEKTVKMLAQLMSGQRPIDPTPWSSIELADGAGPWRCR